jgi:type II secretory pathway pseudopilin PulG
MRGSGRRVMRSSRGGRQFGFSATELMIVILVALIMAAFAIANFLSAVHAARLRGAGADFAGLLQVARIRAVDDDRYYSVYLLPASGVNPEEAFVDIYPQNANGASGTGGASWTTGDPLVPISPEISQRHAAAAPNTANLLQQLLPAGSPVTPLDGSIPGTPITFSPRGLPCTPKAVTGGTVCDSLGGPTAYWIFFKTTSHRVGRR